MSAQSRDLQVPELPELKKSTDISVLYFEKFSEEARIRQLELKLGIPVFIMI